MNVRYVFIMMLAIADPKGYVIGTDVAIARRLNMPTNEFERCVEVLMQPDEDSNSKEEGGRRVLQSDGERGYRLVNYLTYREIRDQAERRDYMRTYMKEYRGKKRVNNVNSRKRVLAKAEGEAEGEEEATNTRESSIRISSSEKDRLLRELPENPLSPTREEFTKYLFESCPILSKHSARQWCEMNKFYQFTNGKWLPVVDWKAYLQSLESKRSKQNRRF